MHEVSVRRTIEPEESCTVLDALHKISVQQKQGYGLLRLCGISTYIGGRNRGNWISAVLVYRVRASFPYIALAAPRGGGGGGGGGRLGEVSPAAFHFVTDRVGWQPGSDCVATLKPLRLIPHLPTMHAYKHWRTWKRRETVHSLTSSIRRAQKRATATARTTARNAHKRKTAHVNPDTHPTAPTMSYSDPAATPKPRMKDPRPEPEPDCDYEPISSPSASVSTDFFTATQSNPSPAPTPSRRSPAPSEDRNRPDPNRVGPLRSALLRAVLDKSRRRAEWMAYLQTRAAIGPASALAPPWPPLPPHVPEPRVHYNWVPRPQPHAHANGSAHVVHLGPRFAGWPQYQEQDRGAASRVPDEQPAARPRTWEEEEEEEAVTWAFNEMLRELSNRGEPVDERELGEALVAVRQLLRREGPWAIEQRGQSMSNYSGYVNKAIIENV
ncbi:uncharacterized protein BXZ73DRAFT_75277 [Epithele typhae]|uniref:uncharacterized protein n=1 Tax=Epithele typhae TaxID=378194 RepID=UPI002008ADB7|nr:uncharacterized protein BXZ73DRAFT_75277 [Epithele typhae]KAH9940722.1 hypothetical protein BXZ73DRAFT_75277 [Epithele typhae]